MMQIGMGMINPGSLFLIPAELLMGKKANGLVNGSHTFQKMFQMSPLIGIKFLQEGNVRLIMLQVP